MSELERNNVATVLSEALRAHQLYPYRFLRENDLVCHLVSALQSSFGESWGDRSEMLSTAFGVAGDKSRKGRFKHGASQVRMSRVRTEVKLYPEAGRASRSQSRVDICVLQKRNDLSIYHHSAGVRDVVLKVDRTQVEALIEVKLYPSTYVRRGGEHASGYGWLDDLRTLQNHLEDAADPPLQGHLIFIDTSIPIDYLDGPENRTESRMLYQTESSDMFPFRQDSVAYERLKRLEINSPGSLVPEDLWWTFPAESFSLKLTQLGAEPTNENHDAGVSLSFDLVKPDMPSESRELFMHAFGFDGSVFQPCSWRVSVLESP
jgi:hypothetical protein